METISVLLALCDGYSPVTGEFPAQMPVTRSFDVIFDLWLDSFLSKHWRRQIWDASALKMTSQAHINSENT